MNNQPAPQEISDDQYDGRDDEHCVYTAGCRWSSGCACERACIGAQVDR